MKSRVTRSRAKPGRLSCQMSAIILFALLSLPVAASVTAEGPGESVFTFSGFGTLGLVHSSDHNADFTDNLLEPNGAGYTHPWAADVDSKLGAQVSAQLTSQFSMMLQVISQERWDNSFRPHVEWANISYQPLPEITVRVGRIVLPTYLYSDTRKVGYSNPWVRPPEEFYALQPIYDSDGVDANYKIHLGDIDNTLVATFGSTRFRARGGGEFVVKNLSVIADTVEYGALTLHAAYETSAVTFNALDPLFDYFPLFGPQGVAIAAKYNTDNKQAQFLTAGAIYAPGRWFVMGEWERRNLHSVFGESSAWYVSGGYRLGKVTPFMTFAQTKIIGNKSDPGLDLSGLPPNYAAVASILNFQLNEQLASTPEQHTTSVGLRWDVMKQVDLKMQYDHINLGAGSAGTLYNTQPGFQPGSSVNLVSITIDFVW
jgi:hypothetical protein